MSAPDPKPVRRHKADVDEWKILRKLKLGPCRVCHWHRHPRDWMWKLELHHLVGKDLGGGDVPDNLVPLCADCHQQVEERMHPACKELRASLTLREYAYIVTTKGVDFLNRYYPRRNAEDAA